MFNVVILGITSLLTDISTEMVYPILPMFLVVTLGASPAVLGVIEGLAESVASLMKVFSGYFSDRIRRRKPFTIAGYGGSTIGKAVLYCASSWGWVLVARIIDRVGKGIRTAPRDALIVDSTTEKTRGAAFGLHRAMDTLGACIGVLAAYYLVTHFNGNLRLVLLVSVIPAVIAVAVLGWVRERPAAAHAAAPMPRFRWGTLDRRLKLFLIGSFIFTLGNSSNQFLLLRAKDVGNPIGQVLLMYLAFNVVYALVSYPAARFSDRVGRKALLVVGYLAYAVVYWGFAVTHSSGALWGLFAFYGIYMAFTEGVEKALLADLAPAHLRATAIGLHATVVGVGLLPASVLAGLLWKYVGPAAPFYFGAVMGCVASVWIWWILRHD